MPRFDTPSALVEALQHRTDGARAQLWEWVGEPVRRLLDELRTRHQLKHDLERMTRHALHMAETFLRTRRPEDFATLSPTAFRGAVMLQVARQVVQPFGEQRNGSTAPEPLPESDGYAFQTLYLPYEKVGSFYFGGDWFGGRRTADGSVWVIVADITGHGYYAYLLANALPGVWRMCWERLGERVGQPAELLAAMHDLLEDCLPDGVFAECTLLKLGPGGEVTVAPAGGSRLVRRDSRRNQLELLKLRGLWVGLHRPSADDQRVYRLEVGDELLVGSDGVFDQFADAGGDLAGVLTASLHRGGLFEALR